MPETINLQVSGNTYTLNLQEARDAYQIAVAEGFVGTREEWSSLQTQAAAALSAHTAASDPHGARAHADALVAVRTTDPLNRDVSEVTLTGVLTSDGSTVLPLPSDPLQWGGYSWYDDNWQVELWYYAEDDFSIYHGPTGSYWVSQPGDDLATATWTPEGNSTGTPTIAVNVVETKTAAWLCAVTDGAAIATLWQNRGSLDAPEWHKISDIATTPLLTSGGVVTGVISSTAATNNSDLQLLNRGQIRALHKPSVDGVTLQISDPGATLQIESSQGYSIWWRVNQGSPGSGTTTVTITIDPWYRIAHFNSARSSRLGSIAARLKIAGVANANHSDAGFREWLLIGTNGSGTTGKQLFGSGSGGSFPSTTVTWTQTSQSAPIIITATISASIFGGAVVALELL